MYFPAEAVLRSCRDKKKNNKTKQKNWNTQTIKGLVVVTWHRRWCSRVQIPAVWHWMLWCCYPVCAQIFSSSKGRYVKICRQHNSHRSTLRATAVSSVTVCNIYSSVHWKKDLFCRKTKIQLRWLWNSCVSANVFSMSCFRYWIQLD